jgi:hypothetical protein
LSSVESSEQAEKPIALSNMLPRIRLRVVLVMMRLLL